MCTQHRYEIDACNNMYMYTNSTQKRPITISLHISLNIGIIEQYL